MTELDHQQQANRTNGLRDRIAAVLLPDLEYAYAYNPGPQSPEDWANSLADAVIAELGLDKQSHYDPGCNYHRWVTDWKADDE